MSLDLKRNELYESQVKQQLYFTLNSIESTLDDLIQYTTLIWGDKSTPENMASYEAVLALNKFLQLHPSTTELFEVS